MWWGHRNNKRSGVFDAGWSYQTTPILTLEPRDCLPFPLALTEPKVPEPTRKLFWVTTFTLRQLMRDLVLTMVLRSCLLNSIVSVENRYNVTLTLCCYVNVPSCLKFQWWWHGGPQERRLFVSHHPRKLTGWFGPPRASFSVVWPLRHAPRGPQLHPITESVGDTCHR